MRPQTTPVYPTDQVTQHFTSKGHQTSQREVRPQTTPVYPTDQVTQQFTSKGHQTSQREFQDISPEYSLEGLIMKLKLQSSGRLRQRADSLEKTLMLGKIEGRRRRG